MSSIGIVICVAGNSSMRKDRAYSQAVEQVRNQVRP